MVREQVLNRDGTDIVPDNFQRFVDLEGVRFINSECTWKVFEGIHRVVVSSVSILKAVYEVLVISALW